MYEVELKFPLSNEGPIVEALQQLGAERQAILEQCDRYFAHPVRDFGQTDEALRIRSSGTQNCLTYKGRVVDAKAKTRREIEVPFGEGEPRAEQLVEILEVLGFREVRSVRKRRQAFRLRWEDREVELALDDVAELGTFLEMELQADDTGRDAARDCLLRLAERLGLDRAERRSYLCMLLEQDEALTKLK